MLILGLDTTTLACSAALLDGETLLAEYTLNIRKTHSERLMPLLHALLQESQVEREQLEAIAVAAGPGSFTGIRIGVATARALAQGLNIPVTGVSTIRALAEAVAAPGALICPLLDARRSEVYTALYRREPFPPRGLEMLLAPAALEIGALTEKLKRYNEPVIFTGEGAPAYSEHLVLELGEKAVLPQPPQRLCRAAWVALCGRRILAKNPQASFHEVLPQYLRRPEAERRLAERKETPPCP